MAVYENSPEQQLVDTVPSSPDVSNLDVNDDNASEEQSEPRKKTRRSRRGGYRRKRQQQKKVAALMAASAAERARKAAHAACDGASTATTEGESSSCESTAAKAPERVVARKKGSANYNTQQQQHPAMRQQYYQQQSYYQGPMHPVPPVYPYPAYGYPVSAPVPKVRKIPKSLSAAQKSMYVALDCEMVGCGVGGSQSALARVTLIDWYGNVIMDSLVKPSSEVTDYRTFVSGITKEMLDDAKMDFATARKLVLQHLHGKILVGHALKNDLGVLRIQHPWHMIRDTAFHEPYMKVRFQDGCLWPRSLKELCQEKCGREIQVFGRPHCPKEDALAALDLYRLVWRQWEKSVEYNRNRSWAMQAQPTM